MGALMDGPTDTLNDHTARHWDKWTKIEHGMGATDWWCKSGSAVQLEGRNKEA